MAEMDVDSLMDSVQIKNRVVDGKVAITYNGKEVVWGPGEVKQGPRKLAEWFVYLKSLYKFNPGDHNEGIPASYEYKLAILGDGKDERDLTKADLSKVKELLDVENMPDLVRVDPQTGKVMKRVYIDPRSTGVSDMAQRRKEEAVMTAVSKEIVSDAAEKIADAAEHASEGEIEAAVAELTGTARAGE